jgi:hypothetical protein
MSNEAQIFLAVFLAGLYLLLVPVLVIVVLVQQGQVKKRLKKLEQCGSSSAVPSVVARPVSIEPPALPVTVPAMSKVAASSVLSNPVATATEGSDPFVRTLRDFGLFPPSDLKGEFALGAWWTVRVGGVLALAAVVFLGIWLNLHSVLPAWVRLSELIILGALLLGGGLKLQTKREDLGRVIGAAGLGVFVFAAWAAYGLEKMRVLSSAMEAGRVQFYVSILIAGFALYRRDRLYAQLAVIFTTTAIFFAMEPKGDALALSLSAGSVALLGAIFYARGGWASTGVLGLVGSQVALLGVWDQLQEHAKHSFELQIGAGLSLLALWCGERFVIAGGGFKKESARVAFYLSLVLAPCLVGVLVAVGSENERFNAALFVASLTAALGLLELRRSFISTQILWGAALVFVGTAFAWKVEQKMVWLVWVLACAVAQLAAWRTTSKILRWVSEGLAAVAVISYLDAPPHQPWFRLLALALFALLVVWREWGAISDHLILKGLSILGLVLATLSTQSSFPTADTGWSWLVVIAIGLLARCPMVIWAAAPAYFVSHWVIVEPSFSFRCFIPKLSNHLSAEDHQAALLSVWSWILAICDLVVVAKLFSIATTMASTLRFAWQKWVAGIFAVSSAVMLLAGIYFAFGYYTVEVSDRLRESCYVILWVLGAVGMTLMGWWLQSRSVVNVLRLPLLVGFIAGLVVFHYGIVTGLKLKETLFWMAGLAVALVDLHQWTEAINGGRWYRSIFAVVLMVITFVAMRVLPGAGVSLFWALSAALLFIIGFKFERRSFRMVALAFLAVATLRVLTTDVTDILGRVIACGAVAIIFLAMAWVYTKFAKSAVK